MARKGTSSPNASDPMEPNWEDQMDAAWASEDLDAVQELLARPNAQGRQIDESWWREKGRLALNAQNAPLLDIARGQAPKNPLWMGAGWSEGIWAMLNGHHYAKPGCDDTFHEALAQRVAVDAPISVKSATGPIDADCANGRWRPLHAAAHHKNAKLAELYVQHGHSPDGWRENGPKPASAEADEGWAGGVRRGGWGAAQWSSGYVVPGVGNAWSVEGSEIDRSGAPGELPEQTPLVIACQRKALPVAQALVRLGARSAFPPGSEKPRQWRAAQWMAANALAADTKERDAIGWARLALRTLGPQGEKPVERDAAGVSSAPAAILALARTAREALLTGNRATRANADDASDELLVARGAGRLFNAPAKGFFRALVASRAERMESAFWIALGLRDAERLREWARSAAQVRSKGKAGAARVGGLPPVAWIAALALAEETRGREENRSARMFWRGAPGAGPASALLAPLAKELGAESLNEPVGSWGGLSAAQMSAVCDAPATCRILLDLGARPGEKPEGSLLEAAARGLSPEANEIALGVAAEDPNPMVAIAVWMAANEPEQALQTLKAASGGEPAAFARRWGESIESARAGAQKKHEKNQGGSEGARANAWRQLIALAESLLLSSELGSASEASRPPSDGAGEKSPAESSGQAPGASSRAAKRL